MPNEAVQPGPPMGNPWAAVGVQLGLGPAWQPGPASWQLGELTMPRVDDEGVPMVDADGDPVKERAVVLVIHTGSGTVGIVLNGDAPARLADQLYQQHSGLVIARPGQ